MYSEDGTELLLLLVKRTWAFRDKRLVLADCQQEVVKTPQFEGDPLSSCLRYETDYYPKKSGTDLLLCGTLVVPRCTETDFLFQVDTFRKCLHVTGERHWYKSLVSYRISEAQCFERMPLSYERAFGGTDRGRAKPDQPVPFPENPLGRGFFLSNGLSAIENALLPNLEDPADRLTRPCQVVGVACLAPIPPTWRPRARFAGTYDDHWADSRHPLLPTDFDPRYYVTGPQGMYAVPHLRGNEELSFGPPNARFHLKMPGVIPRITVRFGILKEYPIPTLETLQVDLDRQELTLTWKAQVSLHKRLNQWPSTDIDMEGRL